MREIKFRDWNPETKEMRYFDLDWYDREEHNSWWNIMQFTWLKDKNWIDIYEWDIICWEFKKNTIVEYWKIYYEMWMAIWFDWFSSPIELVSNIHKKREENTLNHNNSTY